MNSGIPNDLTYLDFRLDLETVRKMTAEQQEEARIGCRYNLRFLINCVLRPRSKKFPTLVENVHGKIIDAFLKPLPDKELEEWSDVEEFVVLASRGMLKSTIGTAFLTQMILCSPDVRILILSGKLEKAESILDVARKPFYSNEVLRFLFPEWAIAEGDLRVEEFVCPRRNPEIDFRDPTIAIGTFDSVKAGGHHEILLFDDATNEINSGTFENALKTHEAYDDTSPLVEPGGYRLLLATKWQDEDLPEYIRKMGELETEKSGRITVSYFSLPGWTLKPTDDPREFDARARREKTGTLVPDDVILTWPEKLTANFLFPQYRKNRSDFYKQYLLDASIEQQKSFTPEILQRQFRGIEEMYAIPNHDRAVVVHWDFSSVFTGNRKKSETDFTCGIIGVFQRSTGKLFVAQVVMAHYNNADDVGAAMVSLYKEASHLGDVVGHSMEDSSGARNLESSIYRVASNSHWESGKEMKPIYWLPPDKKANAKNIRISVLASAMKNGFVVINANVSYINDLRSQFEKWSITAKNRKDDGPDCIAQIWQNYRSQISPNQIQSLAPDPNAPLLSWEQINKEKSPWSERPLKELVPDPHMDEMQNADIEFLSQMTVPYAGQG